MIAARSGLRVWVATQPVDFRRGVNGLAALVAQTLGADPYGGEIFVFRSKRADRIKLLAWDGTGIMPVRQVPGFTLNPFPFGRIILARWRVGAQQPGRRGGSIGYIV